MSKVSMEIIETLKKYEDDDESYHGEFDTFLEEKLMELDPEWMKEMKDLYRESGCSRWYD